MHLKRNVMPKIWPMKRKGTKYIVRPKFNIDRSVPILIVLRDMLKFAETRKEADKILDSGKIKVNEKVIREKKHPITLFDVLTLENKHYRMIIENKKYKFQEISAKESKEKVAKIIGKKILKDKVVQLNLSDGRNFNTKEKLNTNDSVLVNLSENKITQVIPLKKGAKVIFTKGKYIGQIGVLEEIENSDVIVKLNKDKISSKKEFIMAVN